MRSVFSSGEKKDDKKNLAVLEKLQEAAAFGSDDFFVFTIGEPIADLCWSRIVRAQGRAGGTLAVSRQRVRARRCFNIVLDRLGRDFDSNGALHGAVRVDGFRKTKVDEECAKSEDR